MCVYPSKTASALPGAIADYNQAIRLKPDDAYAYNADDLPDVDDGLLSLDEVSL